MDYGYMIEKDKSMPLLAMKSKPSDALGATFCDKKGESKYVQDYTVDWIRSLGYKRIRFKCDNEPAILALKLKITQELKEIEIVPEEATEGESQENGVAENAVKEIKRQMRAIHGSIEEKYLKRLDPKDPMLSWLPRHAAQVRTKYVVGQDGKTAYERINGKKWR